ncbi:MAG: amidohydrolase family protein [Coriobacteriales bacterium]|jgi:predicted TIM-barrel fold metal-dependent hydrolase|nr:amidohydrolase family protein [Coriobacteriales bacterium]
MSTHERIIDIHCHIYPEKIAAKAVAGVGAFYGMHMEGEGSPEALAASAERHGIDYCLVHSVATTAHQVTSINDFIAKQQRLHPEFIGFATIHQDFEDMEGELARIQELGLHGIKIHPDSQKVNMDDPRLMRLYELIEGKLPIMIHCGDYRYDYSHPRRLVNILHTFPNLVVDAAHFGGWSLWDLAVEYLEHESCMMDLSSSMYWLGARRTRELIEIYGADRVMFGSDFPMETTENELRRFDACQLDVASREQILWQNGQKYLGMDLR